MLINLDKRISVQKFADSDHEKWICYEKQSTDSQLKGTIWKQITGLFSGAEMLLWLDQKFADKKLAKRFSKLSRSEF